MSIRSNYSEQLEAYFSGQMQGVDRLVFEGRVESDPVLKAEFENQREIIEGLRAHRSLELKTRLNNVSVDTTVLGALMQSSAFKPVFYAMTGVAVSLGTFFFYTADDESAFEHHLELLYPKYGYLIDNHLQPVYEQGLTFRYSPKPISTKEDILPIDNSLAKSISEDLIPHEISFEVPVIDAGIAQDNFQGAPLVTIESPQRIENAPSVSKIERVNIQTVISRKYNFHYRMEDNRLYLYGKFNESPYEIIEINSPGVRKLFFYYNGDFFGLNKDAALVTPLSKIHNRGLINELELIKNESL